jgi:hypothetical protein
MREWFGVERCTGFDAPPVSPIQGASLTSEFWTPHSPVICFHTNFHSHPMEIIDTHPTGCKILLKNANGGVLPKSDCFSLRNFARVFLRLPSMRMRDETSNLSAIPRHNGQKINECERAWCDKLMCWQPPPKTMFGARGVRGSTCRRRFYLL